MLVLVVIPGSRRVEGFIYVYITFKGELSRVVFYLGPCFHLWGVKRSSLFVKTSDSAEMNVVPFLAA